MRTHAFFLLIMVIFMFMMRMKNYILFKESERMTLTFILLLILARKDDWWLFTTKGSYRFHLSTRQVRLDNPINIPNARFVRDNQGDFYVFNQTGVLHYFQKETGICKILSLIDAAQMMPAAEERYEVIQDNRGLIWISTFGYGLFVYNPQEDIISHYTYQETGKNLVHSNFLHSYYSITREMYG